MREIKARTAKAFRAMDQASKIGKVKTLAEDIDAQVAKQSEVSSLLCDIGDDIESLSDARKTLSSRISFVSIGCLEDDSENQISSASSALGQELVEIHGALQREIEYIRAMTNRLAI